LDEKQEGEFSILGHLSHNVKPNLQIAKSNLNFPAFVGGAECALYATSNVVFEKAVFLMLS